MKNIFPELTSCLFVLYPLFLSTLFVCTAMNIQLNS